MRYFPYNCQVTEKVEPFDFTGLIATQIPALHPEPDMPPDAAVSQWVLVYYEKDLRLKEDRFWTEKGADFHRWTSPFIKVNDDAKRTASAAMGDATTDEEKVSRLFTWCRTNLKDVHGDVIGSRQREQAKRNENTAQTISRGAGTSFDITLAFAALAQAAGFDAELAWPSDRSEFLFDTRILTTYFLHTERPPVVAVKLGGRWQFYSPSNGGLPPGQLPWYAEGVPALLASSSPEVVTTPITPADASKRTHIAEFKLDQDGNLEGDVREILTGHWALTWRSRLGTATDAEREEKLKRELNQQFPSAEISSAKFSVPDDPAKGIGLHYHVKVAAYAQRTGKRLFLTPDFFEMGTAPRFTSATREHPIYFAYPWSENDSIRIKLPDGYELDQPDPPSSVSFGAVGQYTVRVGMTKDKTLVYTRGLVFGADGMLVYDKAAYPQLKQLFDTVHERDLHAFVLKNQADAAPASASN
jgi:hypothetical protein